MWWLVAAVGLGIPLVITTMPEFGMFSAGAIAGSITAAVGGNITMQVIVFAVVSTALIAVVRPIANRNRTQQRPDQRTGIDALKGKQAVVLERVDGRGGQIKLAGEVWSARALQEDQVYEPGQRVDVVDIDGATAVVM
ncbi:hypothetical protein SRB5_66420 [Streptomyces sp. RB5]|uniref:NfeD-like C-terminal domain-containing protein n=1 Tax=Streptomyces smaragdinus TaxID=2585196 RepID=A0A7K0CSV8_9ACTN|nr:NfeD family protein [Streptomyces smaragdinus]MQY16443.1 hypothetical protein [Streptomyces smaragdinus]